jgi:hypothetical protein
VEPTVQRGPSGSGFAWAVADVLLPPRSAILSEALPSSLAHL